MMRLLPAPIQPEYRTSGARQSKKARCSGLAKEGASSRRVARTIAGVGCQESLEPISEKGAFVVIEARRECLVGDVAGRLAGEEEALLDSDAGRVGAVTALHLLRGKCLGELLGAERHQKSALFYE